MKAVPRGIPPGWQMPFPGRTMAGVIAAERKSFLDQVTAHLYHDCKLTRAEARIKARKQVAAIYAG